MNCSLPQPPPTSGCAHHRPDRRQIVIGLTVDKHGLPLASDIFTGNTVDVQTVKTTVAKLSRLGINRCLFVSDSGMVSSENLKALSLAGLQTLVGTRMRQLKQVNSQVLTKRGRFVELGKGIGAKQVEIDGYRYIVVKNDSQARKDAKVRTEIVERLVVLLDKIAAKTASVCDIQHPMMKRFVRILKDGQVKLNSTKVRKDAIYDGKYVLCTTADVSLSDAVAAYKTLYRVEQSFRTIKSVLKIRPMYHHADHRIESHVKLCVLAYFVVGHVEIITGESWETIVRLFSPLRIVEIITDAGVVHRRSRLTDEQKAILKALSLRYPKEIQKVSLNT